MMSFRRLSLIGLFWALSLAMTAVWTARAQEGHKPVPPKTAPGLIITSENLGFRLEGRRGGVATGTLLVRIDGEWVEARSSFKILPVK